MNNTLATLLRHLGRAMAPLSSALADPQEALLLLADVGITVPATPTSVLALGPKATAALDALQDLETVADWTSLEALEKTLRLADALRRLFESVNALAPQLQADVIALSYLEALDLSDVAERLVGLLLARYLWAELPLLAAVLELASVLEVAALDAIPADPDDPEAGEPVAPGRIACRLQLQRIQGWVQNPTATAAALYGWGTVSLESDRLLEAILRLFHALGHDAALHPAPDAAFALAGILEAPEAALELRAPVLRDAGDAGRIELGLGLIPVPETGAGCDGGLLFRPYLLGASNLDLPLLPDLHLVVTAGLDAAGGVALMLRPTGPALVVGGGGAAQLGATLSWANEDGSPLELAGQPGLLAIRAGVISLTIGAGLDTQGFEGKGEILLQGGDIHLGFGDADSFLGQFLPKDGLDLPFEIALAWSSRTGFAVRGGAGFELELRIGKSYFGGVLRVDKLRIGAKAGAGGLTLQIAAMLGSEIGPFSVTVRDLGMEASLAPHGGNLGIADLGFAFKPPTGVGLSLETPLVKAAGIVVFDPDHRRYLGGIELSVLKKFDLTIVGLVTTRMPDGTEGWAILLIIAFRFPVPIFIAYNFYLAGVGGILGLNRTIDVDRMRRGLQAGSLDSILFPTDIVTRLDQIVSDLEGIFPPERDQFLVGPMALIEWSQPAIIRVKLGLVIEFAHPVRIAILGILEAQLPDAEKAVLSLKVAFLGLLDIEKGLLSFDASIYDSYFGCGDWKFSLEGDMAMRLSFGARKDFVNSVGGFHPVYTPPTDLSIPRLRRISISLLKDNPHLSLSCYFAVTTNTIQFGARVDVLFKVSGFSIVGDLGFDVLFQFSPFRFLAEVYGHLAVKSGNSEILGISLDFTLAGPAPWIARGHASFKILFVKVKVDFEKRFGEDTTDALPEVAVLPKLLEELGKHSAWRGELCAGATTQVRLIERERKAGEIVIDAAGIVAATQNILPLGHEFTLFANARPSDARQVRISEVRIGGVAIDKGDEFDSFAPAAFREMSDADKLKASAYESMPSGFITRSVGATRTEQVVPRPVRYERIVSDVAAPGAAADTPPTVTRLPREHARKGDFERLVPGGAVRRSAQAIAKERERQKRSVICGVAADERFAVLSTADLRPVDASGTPVNPVHTQGGRPEYASGILITRSAAEARRAGLIRAGNEPTDFEVAPEAQLAA